MILAVDDDASVLETVVQDLRRQYGRNYRILRAASGQAALDLCDQIIQRGDRIALILSDQRMPGMTGVEFLTRVIEHFPVAKRVLLTAYADTEAAIRAINTARIHYYLTKPWDPPEECLYPVLDDLLESWKREDVPPFEGLRVLGQRFSPQAHQVRDFLSRQHVPYRWLEPGESSEAAELVAKHQLDDRRLPIVVFPDGGVLVQPDRSGLAARIGLRVQASEEFYDVVIIGAGPAGLGAAVCAASEGLRTLVVEKNAPGGQAGSSSRIENYLGFPSGLSGDDLGRRAHTQAVRFGAEFLIQKVVSIRAESLYKLVRLGDGREVTCHVCLIASGVRYRRVEVPGMERLTGAGVYYGAALSEARACSDEEVLIIGGANSAGQAAMHFSSYAKRVIMLVRGPSLERSMSKYLIDRIAETSNIQVKTESQIVEARGDGRLESLRLRGPAGEETISCSSVFIFIGAEPDTSWLPQPVMRDPSGFVLSGPDLKMNGEYPHGWSRSREPFFLETGMPGVFTAGDVRHGSVKRVASAVGEGTMAVQLMHQYLRHL